ncbi:MAG TPA: hypothetical protein VFC53_12775 [Dehalococcoidia bacterium]|nr:hypothetical protein [Dehalococcoidia bacterium]
MYPATPRQPPRTSAGLLVLGAGLLAAPMVWSLHLLVSYLLVSSTCGLGTRGVRTEIAVITLVALAAIAAAGLASLAAWRRRDYEGWPREYPDEGRPGFMAHWGVFISAMFFVATLFTAAPVFVLTNCG